MIPLLLFAMSGGGAPPAGPVAPVSPVSVHRSFYSGGRIQINVVLGDATAFTRIYAGGVLKATLDPGITTWQSALFSLASVEATHYKDGLESEPVGEEA